MSSLVRCWLTRRCCSVTSRQAGWTPLWQLQSWRWWWTWPDRKERQFVASLLEKHFVPKSIIYELTHKQQIHKTIGPNSDLHHPPTLLSGTTGFTLYRESVTRLTRPFFEFKTSYPKQLCELFRFREDIAIFAFPRSKTTTRIRCQRIQQLQHRHSVLFHYVLFRS